MHLAYRRQAGWVSLDPRKLTRASEQLREVGRRLMGCYLRRTKAVGVSDR